MPSYATSRLVQDGHMCWVCGPQVGGSVAVASMHATPTCFDCGAYVRGRCVQWRSVIACSLLAPTMHVNKAIVARYCGRRIVLLLLTIPIPLS